MSKALCSLEGMCNILIGSIGFGLKVYRKTGKSRSLKSEWVPVNAYMTKLEAQRDISFYLMDYYNWSRPHQFNYVIAPANAESLSNLLTGNS